MFSKRDKALSAIAGVIMVTLLTNGMTNELGWQGTLLALGISAIFAGILYAMYVQFFVLKPTDEEDQPE